MSYTKVYYIARVIDINGTNLSFGSQQVIKNVDQTAIRQRILENWTSVYE